jgi:hypothetical protein
MQCACAILLYVACPAVLYFPKLSHKRHDVRKYHRILKVRFDFLYNFLSETFLILRRTERDMAKTYTGLHVDFNETCMFSANFQKILKCKFS